MPHDHEEEALHIQKVIKKRGDGLSDFLQMKRDFVHYSTKVSVAKDFCNVFLLYRFKNYKDALKILKEATHYCEI